MSERSEIVSERVRSALQAPNPTEIVKGVKDAVAEELTSLSPEAKLTYTSYFNHSYMPDMVLDWNDGRAKESRPIFLRNRVAAGERAEDEDVRALASRDPVILTLTPTSVTAGRTELLRSQVQSTRTLVTGVDSLAEVAEGSPSPSGASPLITLVRSNLVRGGRGLLTSEDAERLVQSAQPSDSAPDGLLSAEFLDGFLTQAQQVFAPDAALRLRRSAELLRFGLTGAEGEGAQDEGRLSKVELGVLLPYLLARESSRQNQELWVRIGAMMTFEDLEDMWSSLPDVDVQPLVLPNLRNWSARRSQFVLNASFDAPAAAVPSVLEAEDEGPNEQLGSESIGATDQEPSTSVETPTPSQSKWTVRNRMLAIELDELRILLSSDSRRLKGRDLAGVPARWDDISGLLNNFELIAVDLRGASRRIYVSAERSGDVKADVARIRATIDDDFHVTEVTVVGEGDESDAAMAVHFGAATATASLGAPLISLLQAAAALLAYKMPLEARSQLVAAGGPEASVTLT